MKIYGLFFICFIFISCSSINRPILNSIETVKILEFSNLDVPSKIDSGAESSTIHAETYNLDTKDGKDLIMFSFCHKSLCPKNNGPVKLPIIKWKQIRSSNGHISRRPVIALTIEIKGVIYIQEFTVYNRSKMNYPILIGREAVKGRFYISPD